MWITKVMLICCLATATLTSSETKPKKHSSNDSRGKRNLEYSIVHPYPPQGYRAERRISTLPRLNQYPTHKHYITFRRGRPAPSPPPYAVQMEPLVHYSQRDPLYEGSNLPSNTGNDLVSDYNHVHPQTYGHPPPKIIEKPIYIKEPEPIIEIIIKESNVTLPPQPTPEIVTQPPKKKEPVHVFYVKYKKNPDGYGKESIIYDKPIPAISPQIEDEPPQQQEPPPTVSYPLPVTPAPQTPSTTLRAVIKPESDYIGNKHIHIRFEKEQNGQYKRESNDNDDSKEESAPEPVISQPQSRKFVFGAPPPPSFQGRLPPNFTSKILSRPPPSFHIEGRFPPSPSYRPYIQPPPFKSHSFHKPNQFIPPPNHQNLQPPSSVNLDRLPPPSFQQQLPSPQYASFRQPVPYKPFNNYINSDSNQKSHQQTQSQYQRLVDPFESNSSPQRQRPTGHFDQNQVNTPPQSFSTFKGHFPDQQHLPQEQRHQAFHSSQPIPEQPPKQFISFSSQQQQSPIQNQHRFNNQLPQTEYSEDPKSSQLPQSLPLIGTFGNNNAYNNFVATQNSNQNKPLLKQQNFENQAQPIHQSQLHPNFQNKFPQLTQSQLLPDSHRLQNFNSPPQYQQPQPHLQNQQPQPPQTHLQNQQPQAHLQNQRPQPPRHENNLPPGGELIPSVSKFEQHITVPSESNQQTRIHHFNSEQQVNTQKYLNQKESEFQQSEPGNYEKLQYQQHQQLKQPHLIQNLQSQSQFNNYHNNPSETYNQNLPGQQPFSYVQKSYPSEKFVTQSPHRFSSVYSTTTARTTYSSTTALPTTTTTTSTTKNPQSEEKAKKNILELPDEVPDDLRQQLLSSGILENAHISVLDYDKVGDIPLSALPPDQLSQFFGAGGKEAISAGSEPVPSFIRKNGNPMEIQDQDQEAEGSEPVEKKISPLDAKILKYESENTKAEEFEKSVINEGSKPIDGGKYTRYLPIKVNGAQFPLPDVAELRSKAIASVVVLSPVEYSNNNKGTPVQEVISESRINAGFALKKLIKNPTKENFIDWLDIENKTTIDKQSVVLLVTKPEETKSEDEKEIFMYDLNTMTVSKLSGDLSSAFVEAAEANTNEDLEAIAPSNIVETRVPYPEAMDRQDTDFAIDDFQYDLSNAPSEVVESRIPIIDPMVEKDEYEVEASEQLEQFVDISGLKIRPKDLAAAASDNIENKVIVSSGYSKTGSNKMPSPIL